MIRILDYDKVSREEIFDRSVPTANVTDIVADIIATVRREGDKALYAYAEKFDRAVLSSLEVSEDIVVYSDPFVREA